MTRAKVIIREKGAYANSHEYDVISAKVNKNGRKKPDDLEVVLPMQARARKDDIIYYIEDIADLDYCCGIWNFQFSGKDERGYETDTNDIIDARFSNGRPGKFYGQWALEFDAASFWTRLNTSLGGIINMSGQFDIYVWFTPSASQVQTKPIVFSKYDGLRGIEIGFDTSGGAGNWRPLARVGNGTTTTEIIGTSTKITASQPNLIRVYRNDENDIFIETMGVQDDETLNESASLEVGSTAIYFGGGSHSVNDRYNGALHQVRIYCGSTLSEDDSCAILRSKPQPYVMQFGGRIWDSQDITTAKKVKAQSWAQMFNDWFVDSSSITEPAIGGVTRAGNVYAGGQGAILIARDLINNYNENFDDEFLVKGSITGLLPTGDFTAVGYFGDLVSLLSIFSLYTFYTTPRKIIIFEAIVGQDTDYIFDQDDERFRYDIKQSEDSDIAVYNDVSVVGSDGTIYRNTDVDTAAGETPHAYTLNVPQFASGTDLDVISFNILTFQAESKSRYVVVANASIPHARYNLLASVSNASKVLADRDVISSIETHYPSGRTIVNIGTHKLDSFDMQKSTNIIQKGLVTNTTV